MAYCPKCGRLVSVRDTYCRRCGERLDKQGQGIRRRCEFCKGTGNDPGDGNINVTVVPCRVCKGAKGGYFSEEYRRCEGECRGNGRIKVTTGIDIVDNFRPCHDCGGWGWAKH
jgi:DnaJ-class molecular chaperone